MHSLNRLPRLFLRVGYKRRLEARVSFLNLSRRCVSIPAATRYRRVRIARSEDVQRLPALITALVTDPLLNHSITELAIDPGACQSSGGFLRLEESLPPDESMPSGERQESSSAAVVAHVRGLGLDNECTEMMLRALDPTKGQVSGGGGGTQCGGKGAKLAACSFADAATILILSLCRNITRLYAASSIFGDTMTYREGNGRRSIVQDYLLQCNYGLLPGPSLQKLERVEIVPGSSWMDMDERCYLQLEIMDVFQFFHRLPAVRSFVLDGVQEYQSCQSLFVPRTANLTSISLRHTDIPNFHICTMISIPRALEEFRLSIGGMLSRDGGSPLVIAGDVGSALLEHRGTLRVLDLDLDTCVHSNAPKTKMLDDDYDDNPTYSDDLWEQDSYQTNRYGEKYLRLDRNSSSPSTVAQTKRTDYSGYPSIIGSFHEFEALTHLSISIKALLGVPDETFAPPFRLIDALPTSLEYLCLYGYTKGKSEKVDSHIEELMEKAAERLPRLKEAKGVNHTVEDLMARHDHSPGGDETWKRPDTELEWEEV